MKNPYTIETPYVMWEGERYYQGKTVYLTDRNAQIWRDSGIQLDPQEAPEGEEKETTYHQALTILANAGVKPETRSREDVFKALEALNKDN